MPGQPERLDQGETKFITVVVAGGGSVGMSLLVGFVFVFCLFVFMSIIVCLVFL